MPRSSVLLLILSFLVTSFLFAQQVPHLYSTWETVETDKLASIWLIKRFVDKEAEFKFYPQGELISEGIPFDVPEAELRVQHNLATFETVINKFKIDDPVVKEIAEIIHDIEINFWGKKQKNESEGLNKAIQEIIGSSKNNQDCLKRSLLVFDRLYDTLSIK